MQVPDDVFIPPPNRPPFTSWKVRRIWYFVCAFTALTPFIFLDISSGKVQADAGAIWLIIALNVLGHVVLLSLIRYARRWEKDMVDRFEDFQQAVRRKAKIA